MSKSIKVAEDVYKRLLAAQSGRETFSETVERLLNVKDGVRVMINTVTGQKAYQDWAKEHGSGKENVIP